MGACGFCPNDAVVKVNGVSACVVHIDDAMAPVGHVVRAFYDEMVAGEGGPVTIEKVTIRGGGTMRTPDTPGGWGAWNSDVPEVARAIAYHNARTVQEQGGLRMLEDPETGRQAPVDHPAIQALLALDDFYAESGLVRVQFGQPDEPVPDGATDVHDLVAGVTPIKQTLEPSPADVAAAAAHYEGVPVGVVRSGDVWTGDDLTEEPPRPPAQLAADALDVVERLEGVYAAPRTPAGAAESVRWQAARLARQVAELAQHVERHEDRLSPPVGMAEPALRSQLWQDGLERPVEVSRLTRPGRPTGQPAGHAEVEEGLSRAVVGGIVTSWRTFPDPTSKVQRWAVDAADGLSHVYTPEEVSGFADAVFAAERAVAPHHQALGQALEDVRLLRAERDLLWGLLIAGAEDGWDLQPLPEEGSDEQAAAVEAVCRWVLARLDELVASRNGRVV